MRVLFVCLGNICRSPAAETVMNRLIAERGVTDRVQCDSAGTSRHHVGESPDARMQQALSRRGYEPEGRARQVNAERDFQTFDLLVGMDDENCANLRRLAPSEEARAKVVPMCQFLKTRKDSEVPDPYFGGASGFDLVIDILEDACGGLLAELLG